MKKYGLLLFIFFQFFASISKAQYISTSETVPFVCPSVCAGGTLVLKIFQLQNLSVGAQVQAVLSNSSGGFGSGTTTISCNRYSLVSVSGPWTNGPYTFSTNVSNLFFEFTIPISATPSNNYNVHFKSGSTVGANMQMPCTGFTVTPTYTPLASIVPSTYGIGQWIAHAYTWTPTTSSMLNTPALIAAQDFFNVANYKGHFLKNTLNFDLDFTNNGGKMPGPLTVLHDGTSFQCGDGYSTNFSLRFYRTENFAAGMYSFAIGADDGVRLSIDGGLTWLLDIFQEQPFTSINTFATHPNGICLSGPTNLVVEFFQRPADAHVKFACTLLSTTAISQPSDTSICAGQNAAFTISSLAGASYQWQVSNNGGVSFTPLVNSAPYSGVTSNSLVLNSAAANLNANLYNCIVTGVCTSPITTANALLTVTTSAPVITTQPHDSTVCNLGSAAFSVSTAGTALYQWQIDSSGVFVNIHNGGSYSNVTASTLTVSPITTGMNNLHYQCLVTGCGVSVTTAVVSLYVTPSAAISVQPANATVCAGNNSSFSVQTTGTVSSYQWQENTGSGFVNLVNGGNYSNVTSATLNINNVNASMNGYQYQCVVTGCGSGINSVPALLTVGALASITAQPSNLTLCQGAAGILSIGTAPGLTYQWQVNTGGGSTNLSNGALYSGVTTDSLHILSMQVSMNNYQYQCVVTGCGGSSVTSNAITINLGTTASILLQPQNVILCGSGNATFSVQANNALSYQWMVNTGGGFVNLSNSSIYANVNGSTLSLTGVNATYNGYQYQCSITSCSGNSIMSSTALLTVNPLAAISAQPQNQTVCEGGSVTFSFSATNVLAYSWNGGFGTSLNPLANGGNIQINANSITFLNVAASMNNFTLYCSLSDCSGNTSTNTVSLTVTPQAVLNSSPSNQSICEGDNVTFSVVAANAISYQWQVSNDSGFVNLLNGGVYSNVNTSTLTLTNATVSQNALQYKCVVGGCANSSLTSTAAVLTVLPVANLLAQSPNVILCEGASTSLFVTPSIPGVTFQWQVDSGSGFTTISDGGIYSGSSTDVLSISNVSAAEDGNIYQCLYTSCGPSKTSLPIPFAVQTLPKIVKQPVDSKVCEGDNASFSVEASGKNLTYQWQISSDGGISYSTLTSSFTYQNVTTASLQITGVNADMKQNYYRCEVKGCNQSIFSDAARLDATENANTLFIPSAFSPNNDGINDYFQVDAYGLKGIHGQVFDRWGELIFEWNSLLAKWDGSYKGMKVPLGVYVYSIEAMGNCADQKLEKKGTISVFK